MSEFEQSFSTAIYFYLECSHLCKQYSSNTLMGGWGPGGGGGTSSVLRIQKGNSFTTLVPYDFETVTRNKYLQQAQSCGFPSHRNTLAEHKCGGTLLLLLHTTYQFDSFEISLHSSTNAPSVCLYGNSFVSFAVSLPHYRFNMRQCWHNFMLRAAMVAA